MSFFHVPILFLIFWLLWIFITGPFSFFLFGLHRFGQTISPTTIASNLWPLVAVSHQMTVRDAAPLQSEKSDGLISRIQGS